MRMRLLYAGVVCLASFVVHSRQLQNLKPAMCTRCPLPAKRD